MPIFSNMFLKGGKQELAQNTWRDKAMRQDPINFMQQSLVQGGPKKMLHFIRK